MKLHRSICSRFSAALAVFVAAATAAFAFEGKVEMKMTGKNQKETMTMVNSIKGTHYRSDVTLPTDKKGKPGMTISAITNLEAGEIYTLMAEQKMYMVTKLADVQKTAEDVAKKYKVDFKPTGHKETIAGYEAEEYVSEGDNKRAGRTEIWVTKGMGKFIMAQGKGAKPEAWQDFLQKNDLFMLRMISRDKEGAPEETRMEATKVEKTSLPDSLFQPPADFQRVEMPSMKDMMKGMIPGVGR